MSLKIAQRASAVDPRAALIRKSPSDKLRRSPLGTAYTCHPKRAADLPYLVAYTLADMARGGTRIPDQAAKHDRLDTFGGVCRDICGDDSCRRPARLLPDGARRPAQMVDRGPALGAIPAGAARSQDHAAGPAQKALARHLRHRLRRGDQGLRRATLKSRPYADLDHAADDAALRRAA
jgi:hypothetical protein